MKNLATLLFLPLIYSCGGNSSEKSESGNALDNLTLSADTVVMDPGDKVVNLGNGPSLFGLSPEQSRYYFMNRNSGELTVFDLEGKKLIKKIQFEKEGPNAIPSFVNSFQLFDENQFLIVDSRNVAIYDSSKVKVSSIPFGKDKFSDLNKEEEFSLFTGIRADYQKQLYASLPNDPQIERVRMALWDNTSSNVGLVSLPEFCFLTKFTLILQEGNSYNAASFSSLNLILEPKRVLVFASGTSSIYKYDLGLDSLTFKSFNPKFVPSKAETPATSKFSSRETFEEGIKKAREQVFFGDLLWDEKRGFYFRFASITTLNLNPDLPAKNDVFLLAFDRDLNLVGESKVEQLPSQPIYPFFKDGKLWSYVNVEDELGFAVMDFKF